MQWQPLNLDRVRQPPPVSSLPEDVGVQLPIVVVGNGLAGIQTVRELTKRNPELPIVVYGEEPHLPYNRIKLSALLGGQASWEELLEPLQVSDSAKVEERFGVAVARIYPSPRLVEDSIGRLQPYRILILATGSRPHVPKIPGIELSGVFTFRNLDDAQRLLARQVRSRHAVVLGGGLLGIEAAFGMRRHNTCVTLVEHEDRLLPTQLDEGASRVLEQYLKDLGIKTILGNGLRRILGTAQVEGVELRSGRFIPCDTLIVACGIRPRVELALAAGLAVGKGILVNDRMQTSDPNVYAVGECAEHRGRVYGLLAPALEQAKVAASCIAGYPARFSGAISASRLKLAGCPVFSAGPVGIQEEPFSGRELVFCDPDRKLYRKLLLRRLRLVGAVGVGPWAEDLRLQEAVARNLWIWPWRLIRFRRTGNLWPQGGQPAAASVCQCSGATRSAIERAIREGARDLPSLAQATGAGSHCGACRPVLSELLGTWAVQPVRWHGLTLTAGVLVAVGILAVVLLPPIPYPETVQLPWRWDALWREGSFKQISGYTLLGLVLGALSLSLRKRIGRLQALGQFDAWRIAHVLLGPLMLAGLLAHTGGRLGEGLDRALMLCFALSLGLGGVTGLILGQEHLSRKLAAWRSKLTFWHILAFWPLPVLLGFHILKVYWY